MMNEFRFSLSRIGSCEYPTNSDRSQDYYGIIYLLEQSDKSWRGEREPYIVEGMNVDTLPFFNPAAWNPATSFRIITRAWSE
jgi:hypothetical protein